MVLIRKFFAWLLALIQVFFINIGISKPDGLLADVTQIRNEISDVNYADKTESDLVSSAEYAQNIKNVVQCAYTDTARNAYKIENGQISLVHSLTDVEKLATLSDREGNVYFADTFKSFYTDKLGVKHYFEDSTADGRVNTIRLGAFYYECHIRDFKSANFYVDKGFHVYADKLYMEYALLSKLATKAFKGFGSEIEIPKSAVSAVEYKDKNGTGTSFKNMDEKSVEYVAFDIKGAGVAGFIIPSDGSTKSVEVKEKLNKYVITQLASYDGSGLNKYDETGKHSLNKINFGCRIYTDRTHSFDGISTEAFVERNPLKVSITGGMYSNPEYLGYEALRGTYGVKMDGYGFNYPYAVPDFQPSVKLKIEGDGADRNIYIRTTTPNSGCLEGGAILDKDNNVVPIDVEVCKNFMGDGGEPLYSKMDYCYGDTFTPIAVEKDSEKEFTVLNLYQNWGKYPLKQISSIEFHVSYYHLSTGTTESNCIAPYFVYGKDGWLLPDFRCRSGNIWETQPQFNSVGVLKFMSYRDKSVKNTVYSEYRGSNVDSRGLAYSDVTNYYTDDGGKFDYLLRHVEFPQTDENRTYYTLKVDFTDDMTVENFRRDFDIFYFDGRFVAFNKADYLNEKNEPVCADVSAQTTYHKLGSDKPFMGFYSVTDATLPNMSMNVGCNFALIIKDSSIIIGGQKSDIPFVFKESGNTEATEGVLTLDAEKLTFKKGDSIEINMILLPWGTGLETDDSNAIAVREDSALKPVKTTASVGTVVEDIYLPTVKAVNNEAVFTVSGGRGNTAVRVDGFDSMLKPEIYVLSNGSWIPYDVSSANGYDGYTVHTNNDGRYSFSFIYESEDPDSEYSFKVVQ
ncbi:MAG: hypothetical protein MJ168_04325 [Clostridia bacterium]|nr:hypothetical protein [Clostridia bacterium]